MQETLLEAEEIVQLAMKFRDDDEWYSDEDDYQEDESILKPSKGILSFTLTEIVNEISLKDADEKFGDLMAIDDILQKVGHKLHSFTLIGTPLENFHYCSHMIDLLDTVGRSSIFFFNQSSRFQMLSKYKVVALLKNLLSQFAPSAFSHPTERALAEEALYSLGLSPTYVPYYFVKEFFQMTRNIRSATNTPSDESLAAAEEIYKICQGERDNSILPTLQVVNQKSDQRSCEIFRTYAIQQVLSDCFPEGIKFVHQHPVLSINRFTYYVDLCQSSDLNDLPHEISVIYLYKCDSDDSNGPLLHAYCYGLSLMALQPTSQVLLFVITGTVFTVHIQYWSSGVCYLSELQSSTSLNDNNCLTFARWLNESVNFSQNTNLQSMIPSHPFLLPELSFKPFLMLHHLYYESYSNRMYKVYDYDDEYDYDMSPNDLSPACVSNSSGRCPNTHLVQKYYPNNQNILETFTSNLLILSFQPLFATNLHFPKNWNQVTHLIQLVHNLHVIDRYIHGDIRPPNILFPDDSNDCYLIDFDYSRPIDGNYSYPLDYRVENLEILRHHHVRSGGLMEVKHDNFALQECLRYYVMNCSSDDMIPSNICQILATNNCEENNS